MPNEKKTRLTDLDISMVSMVAAGDDPMARIVLSKSAGDDKNVNSGDRGSTISTQQTKETPGMADGNDTIEKDDLPDEVIAYIDALEDEVERLTKDDGDEGESEEDTDATDSEDDATEDEEDDGDVAKALAKADPAVRALFAKQEERIAKAEKIAKDERNERERRDFVAKAQALPMISEKPDDLGGLLQSIHKHDPALAVKVEKVLKAANSQIASANLFGEVGKTGAAVTVSASLDSAAKAEMAKDAGLSYEQATVKAMAENPALYDESLKEN